jgi:hypothetical protein
MSSRLADLRKIPPEPAARLLAKANARLTCRPALPATAGTEEMLRALEEAEAWVDMLRLLSVSLPPRERVWWSCLAARDLLGPDPATLPATLLAAEAWVRRPGDETKAAARLAIDTADPDDTVSLCATAAVFADGTLGAGDLAALPAPPGASEAAAFGMNILAIGRGGGDFAGEVNRLVDRGLDIARGGTGRPDRPSKTSEMAD